METIVHLLITEGPSKGRELHVPHVGVRIGRSSRNDISIPDGAMSRFQCRFFLMPGDGLWVSDLGSANGTMVNGKLVQEQRLHVHDEILAGDTCIRVVNEGSAPVEVPAAAPNAPAAPARVAPVAVDLGLRRALEPACSPASAGPNPMRRNLLWLATLLLLLVLAIFLKKPILAIFEPPPPSPPAQHQINLPVLELMFERVEGSSSNVFRYCLELKDNLLKVEVDDLLSDRHVRRDKKVTPELQQELARSVEGTGVLDLREEYSGLAPGLHQSSDLSVTIGAVTRRIRVLNQAEPEIFANVRAMIEEFGKNELGLSALAVDPAALLEKARNALLQGKKMWDEREVRNGNLHNAIRAYKECEWYLETIQPKPDFYAEATSAKNECIRELQRRYEDLWFLAERSVKLREWKEAERQLKVICEMIPDRSDDRNRNAGRSLLDVERHLTTEK